MSASQFEQLDHFEDHDDSRDRALLQNSITEAFALLNAGARQEAIDRIKQYQDFAARSDAGCYIFGLIYFNTDDLRHALTWFDRALALRPPFPGALSARAIVLQRLGQPGKRVSEVTELVQDVSAIARRFIIRSIQCERRVVSRKGLLRPA